MTILESKVIDQQIQNDCRILLAAKKILSDYYSNYETNSNASKLDKYLSTVSNDMENPLFMLKENLKQSGKTLDDIFIIKQSQLLRLN